MLKNKLRSRSAETRGTKSRYYYMEQALRGLMNPAPIRADPPSLDQNPTIFDAVSSQDPILQDPNSMDRNHDPDPNRDPAPSQIQAKPTIDRDDLPLLFDDSEYNYDFNYLGGHDPDPKPDHSNPPRNTENQNIKDTLSNPLGKLFIQNILAGEGDKGEGQKTFSKDTCQAFSEFCQAFADYERGRDHKMQMQLDQLKRSLKEENIQKNFSHISTSTKVKIPSYFSPTPILNLDSRKMGEANLAFPTRRENRFSGYAKGLNVEIWLNELTLAQENLGLSEEEFKMFMIKCSFGEACENITEYITSQMSVEDIYHTLLRCYDTKISPHDANTKLLNYKVTKGKNLSEVETEVLKLASRASKAYQEGPERMSIQNISAINSLIRGLPLQSRNIASNQLACLSSELRTMPSFTQFVRSLRKFEDSINADIQSNGERVNFNGDLSLNRPNQSSGNQSKDNQSKASKPDQNKQNTQGNKTGDKKFGFNKNFSNRIRQLIASEFNIPAVENRETSEVSLNQVKSEREQKGNEQHQKGEQQKKPYCRLCGRIGHTPVQSCRAMFDNEGRLIRQIPSVHKECTPCFDAFRGKKLYHPPEFCPIRAAAINLYKSNVIEPVGLFKAFYNKQTSD